MTTVRNNLMTIEYYTPYCGRCFRMPRTVFTGTQLECLDCGWKSSFEDEFIKKYKEEWKMDCGDNNE